MLKSLKWHKPRQLHSRVSHLKAEIWLCTVSVTKSGLELKTDGAQVLILF